MVLKAYNEEILDIMLWRLTGTGKDSKLADRRKRPKVDASIFRLFFPMRPSDEYDSAPSRN